MKRIYLLIFLAVGFLFGVFNLKAQDLKTELLYPIIPYPTSLQAAKGEFIIQPSTTISDGNSFKNEANYLQELIQHASGYQLVINNAASISNTIELKINNTIEAAEGYKIAIEPSKIIIAAKSGVGIFRAIQTIRQLLPVTAEIKSVGKQNINLPALTITDEPAYDWRGMHLDVARHFFSINYLKKFIDVMALYKMNKLHLHLTDDQGWRIEIKKYPKLTEEGAWRTFNNQDSSCMKSAVDNPDMAIDKSHIIQRNGKILYGGFYTQAQLKDLVAYAAKRYIDIIPEVDMPGHMMAAIHAYPYLSSENGSKWGELFSTPICPCKETTFEFAENVFAEVMDIFPSKYIHLGADEVDRKTWAQSTECKELMQKEGLKDVAELQSYFVKRMEQFFISKGRQLIGWDEILEGGVSATAYVMYWRGWVPNAPVKAAEHGNFVIMSPGNPLYFDNLPDAHSLENIYHFKVVPEKLTASEAKYILGAQANIWTEHVPSENRADYLLMPRMTALAERVWSKNLDYNSYLQRLNKHFKRLEALNVHYRLPDIEGIAEQNVFIDSAILNIKKPLPDLYLRYTTDGSLPVKTSTEINKPLMIKNACTIKVAAFTKFGLRGDIYTLHYKKEKYLEAINIGNIKSGLECKYYKKYFLNTLGMTNITADSSFEISNISVPKKINAASFGLKYNGLIDVPETGIYTFYYLCDDGGILYIDNKEVVNNDGQHGPIEKSGQVALKKGLHQFKLDFIEAGGGFTLQLKYSFKESSASEIPENWLKHQ